MNNLNAARVALIEMENVSPSQALALAFACRDRLFLSICRRAVLDGNGYYAAPRNSPPPYAATISVSSA